MRTILKFPRPKPTSSKSPAAIPGTAAILRLADHRIRPPIAELTTGPPGACRLEFRGEVQ
jgi:hypothetical protein